jgi:hypothetical protein
MSAKFLAGITHAIVTTSKKADAETTGILAVVDLCYGPGDDHRMGQIQLIQRGDDVGWMGPQVLKMVGGRQIICPVFTGEPHDFVCRAAARAWERVKTDIVRPKYGKRYRVFAGENHQVKVVEDIAA